MSFLLLSFNFSIKRPVFLDKHMFAIKNMCLYNGYKTRKANIMENNVPREKWLYPDRCMKKWLGWILSDHSAYMEEASISERPVEPKPEQSQETISDILEDAWQNAKIVAVQVGTPYDERLLPDIEGAVIGHWDDQVYLQLKNGDTQSIDAADIRNVALLNPDRWWALA